MFAYTPNLAINIIVYILANVICMLLEDTNIGHTLEIRLYRTPRFAFDAQGHKYFVTYFCSEITQGKVAATALVFN